MVFSFFHPHSKRVISARFGSFTNIVNAAFVVSEIETPCAGKERKEANKRIEFCVNCGRKEFYDVSEITGFHQSGTEHLSTAAVPALSTAGEVEISAMWI